MTADEKFFAWLDGELSAAEADAMAVRVAADPELARLAEEHKAMGGRLKAAFDSIADLPLPDRLREAVAAPEAQVIDLGAARTARRPWLDLSSRHWAALAASLAVGMFIGTLAGPGSVGPIEVDGGRFYAAGALGEALETQLASAPGKDETRLGLTFRDRGGAICRSFSEPHSSGLACRSGGRWEVRGVFSAQGSQPGEFRMASGLDPKLAALIDSEIAGEPFDAEQEKAAKARGWR